MWSRLANISPGLKAWLGKHELPEIRALFASPLRSWLCRRKTCGSSGLMYARVFTQILDSSISRNYLTRLVFMDCLLLADGDGILDITADAIARRTNIPLDIVLEAIKNLSEVDPDS